MGNKTSPEIEQQAIMMIAQGYENTAIAKQTGLSVDTIANWKIDKIKELSEIKKALQDKIVNTAAEQLSKLSNDMLRISGKVIAHLEDTFKAASPAQAAVILGILQDKYAMILGNPGQTIALKFSDRNDMIGYIRDGEARKRGRPPDSEKFITVEPEGIPKPLQQLSLERGAANRAKAKARRPRGRPRIHPLQDPSIPKRGRGRPKRVPIIPTSPLSQYIPPVEGTK